MKTIPLTRGLVALVDDEDWALLSRFKWQAHADGQHGIYAETRIRLNAEQAITVKLHNLVMGAPPLDRLMQVDHRNRNRLDCQKQNLRWATAAQNSINWHRRKSTYGRGVWKEYNRYRAAISVTGKTLVVGRYSTPAEARDAYDAAAIEFHGEFAVLNRDTWKPTTNGG